MEISKMSSTVTKRPVTDSDISSLIEKLDALHKDYKFSSTRGRRFVKIWREYKSEITMSQRCIYCFIEASTGDLYKPAGVSQPAVGARGSLYNEHFNFDVHGGCFYR